MRSTNQVQDEDDVINDSVTSFIVMSRIVSKMLVLIDRAYLTFLFSPIFYDNKLLSLEVKLTIQTILF